MQAERVAAGILPAETDRLSQPLAKILDDYIASLTRQARAADHVRITRNVLRRAVRLADWSRWSHLTIDAVHALLDEMAAAGATVSHRNGIVKKLKAFASWATPAGYPSPLAKLHRISERGARQTRGRRAGTPAEMAALFALPLPRNRRLAYALAGFNGLRRNEAARLTWEDLDDDRNTLAVRQKMGEHRDIVPIHPFVRSLLGDRPVTGGLVLMAVPAPETLRKDLTAAGVAWADAAGRRLDYHALRHTFSTAVERAGAGRSIHRRLMRHEHATVTDRYTHAEIQELAAVLARIPWPKRMDAQMDQQKTHKPVQYGNVTSAIPVELTGLAGAATVSGPWPDTQVDYPQHADSPDKSTKSEDGTQKRTSEIRRVATRKSKRRLGLLRALMRATGGAK